MPDDEPEEDSSEIDVLAALVDRVLLEEDGVMSLIRVVDRFAVNLPQEERLRRGSAAISS